MERISVNSRQVPSSKKYLTNPDYFDVLYCHLQVLSKCDMSLGAPIRYIPKKLVNKSRIGAEIGLTRQTVASRLKRLMALGMVKVNEQTGDYYLPTLPNPDADLFPIETIRMLVHFTNDHVVDIYVYLYNRFYASGFKPFQFTYEQLKGACGLSINTKSNSYIVQDILTGLKKMGLIDYKVELQHDKETGEYRVLSTLLSATNKIESD